jgi:hypothetical protein
MDHPRQLGGGQELRGSLGFTLLFPPPREGLEGLQGGELHLQRVEEGGGQVGCLVVVVGVQSLGGGAHCLAC